MSADTILQGPRIPAADGKTRALVVLLHGYGADGTDLAGLAQPLAPVLPGVTFRAPNAPEACRINPMGRQWFSIPWIDGSSDAERDQGFARATETLKRYLEAAMADEGVTPAETMLAGFSQGTMMSLHVGPRLASPLAGIVGFSGRLVVTPDLGEVPSKTPVVLIHGDQDDVIPVAALQEAHDALSAAGFEVSAHISPGTAHGIAPDGLTLAARFMMAQLPDAANAAAMG
ncbi:MAG: dienelactone hydrolase family protein [Pseudomonadota bacterium]